MDDVEVHEYPPEIRAQFDNWDEATNFLRATINRCVDEGYWFRAVEMGHERDFDTKRSVIRIYIRRFPKIVAATKSDKIVLNAMASFCELPILGQEK